MTEGTIFRAGYGITNDPYVLSRPMVTNYPTLVALTLEGANAFQPARPIEQGIPPITVPDLGNGLNFVFRPSSPREPCHRTQSRLSAVLELHPPAAIAVGFDRDKRVTWEHGRFANSV